jgi:hypothetical protein
MVCLLKFNLVSLGCSLVIFHFPINWVAELCDEGNYMSKCRTCIGLDILVIVQLENYNKMTG